MHAVSICISVQLKVISNVYTERSCFFTCFNILYTLQVKENAEALVAATREIGLEVSAHKIKYMVISRDQNAG